MASNKDDVEVIAEEEESSSSNVRVTSLGGGASAPNAATSSSVVTFDLPSKQEEEERRSARPGLVRQENHVRKYIDISSGMQSTKRQSVTEVAEKDRRSFRTKLKALRLFRKKKEPTRPDVASSITSVQAVPSGVHGVSTAVPQQHFRIASRGGTDDGSPSSWFGRILDRLICSPPGASQSEWMSEFLRWTFRTGFNNVFMMSILFWFVLILLFALMIFAIGQYRPRCIFVDGSDFQQAGTDFVDAFHLSWTTLSTVGYGLTSPRPTTVVPNLRCTWINMLMAIEAFVGVLFAGVTGAVIFGKVARVQSIAQVLFSHPICVRYGPALEPLGDDVDASSSHHDDNDDGAKATDKKDNGGGPAKSAKEDTVAPCPILELRIVNQLSNDRGGEILNASVSVVATTLATKTEAADATSEKNRASKVIEKAGSVGKKGAKLANKGVQKAGEGVQKTGAALFGAGRVATQVTGSIVQKLNFLSSLRESTASKESQAEEAESKVVNKELEKVIETEVKARIEEEQKKTAEMMGIITAKESLAVAVDEGFGGLSRLFFPLTIETDSHPFFKRIWNIRHVLDETSPILSEEARQMVADNNGGWPEELNSHEKIRENIKFHEMIVSFSGTGNASGSTVYGQKVYDFADVNIGYTFAQCLMVSPRNGRLMVDHQLLNDVREQRGGGAEPFHDVIDPGENSAAQLAQMATEATTTAVQGVAEAVVNVTGAADEQDKGGTSAELDVEHGDSAPKALTNID